MKQLITLSFMALLSVSVMGQSPAENLSSLKYFLYEAQSNLNSARYYSEDSVKLVELIDATASALNETLVYAESIVVPEEVIVEEDMVQDYNYEDTNVEESEGSGDGEYGNDGSDFNFDVDPFGKMNPLKKIKSHFLVEVGINNLIRSNSVGIVPDVTPGKSWFWNLGLTREVKISKGLDFNFGLTYAFHRLTFGNDVILASDANGADPEFVNIPDLKRDPCLAVHYLTIPLSFDVKLSKNLKVNLGGQAGYRMYTSQRYAIRANSEEIDITRKGNYGLNNWMYGLKGGIGFDNWDIFFQYDMNNLFKQDEPQEYNLFVIGTSFRI